MTFAATSRKRQTNAGVRLTPIDAATLQWQMQQVQLAIASRAYDLFRQRGGEHGHDWEDWFRAESEMLRPVSVVSSELADRISVHINVLGFQPDELKVAVERRRIMILGQKQINLTESERAAEYFRSFPDQIMRIVDLLVEIDPSNPVIELQEGMLKVELIKSGPTAKELA